MTTIIETLKAEMAELQEKLTKLEAEATAKQSELWTPPSNHYFNFVGPAGIIDIWRNTGDENTADLVAFHNVFPVYKKAAKHLNFLRAFNELARVADHVNEGWVPDWAVSEDGEPKYSLWYDWEQDKWHVVRGYALGRAFACYFRSRETAERALELLSNEAKEILKEGVY